MLRLPRRTFLLKTGLAATVLTTGIPAGLRASTTHDVQMLNKHPEDKRQRMVFYPRILTVQPGDTVRFLPVDRGHNAAIIEGMHPDGFEGFDGKINEEIEVTFTQPGYYGYKCTPHLATGMVGLIVVEGDGKLDNLAAAKDVRQRGRAKRVFDDIWAEAEASGLLS